MLQSPAESSSGKMKVSICVHGNFLTRKQFLRVTDELHQPRTRSHTSDTMDTTLFSSHSRHKLSQRCPAASLGSCCLLFPWRAWDEGQSLSQNGDCWTVFLSYLNGEAQLLVGPAAWNDWSRQKCCQEGAWSSQARPAMIPAQMGKLDAFHVWTGKKWARSSSGSCWFWCCSFVPQKGQETPPYPLRSDFISSQVLSHPIHSFTAWPMKMKMPDF